MMLLNSALCSKNFRKVGIIHSSINLFAQILSTLVLIIIVVSRVKNDRDDYEAGTYNPVTNIFIIALFVFVLDVILYSLLIHALVKRKPTLLMVWLTFAPTELILAQVAIFWSAYVAVGLSAPGICIVVISAQILITTYMVHNMCIVFSARHGFIQNQQISNRNLTFPLVPTAVVTNTPITPYNQYNAAHIQNGPSVHNAPNYQHSEAHPAYSK